MRTIIAATFAAAALVSTIVRGDEALVAIAAPAADSMVAAQWVEADADGKITGTVVPPSGRSSLSAGKVSLLGSEGSPLEADVDSSGKFTLTDVTPGVYTLSYAADKAFAAYALQVVAPREGRSFANSTVIVASALNPRRARTTIARYQPARTESLSPVEYFDAPAAPFSPVHRSAPYQVPRNSTGGIDGRLIRAGSIEGGFAPAADANVLILQDGVLVGQSTSAADGTFEIAELEAGSYDLIASGNAGFAALGFEVIEAVEPLARKADDSPFHLVSMRMQGPGRGLEVQMAPPAVDVLEGPGMIGEELPPPEFAGPPMGPPGAPGFAGGGFGGGGFGGGGGGGGGLGGIGGIAALGGIAAAIAIAAADDDDVTPDEASPAGGRGPGFETPPRGRPDFDRPRGPDRGRGRDGDRDRD